MSLASVVRSAWQTAVFEHADIKAITKKVYAYDVLQLSQSDYEKLRYEQEFNFITYVVKRTEQAHLIGGAQKYEYEVLVSVYREADSESSKFNTALDVFETIESLVDSELGTSWSSTVDFGRLPTAQPTTSEVQISGKTVWLFQQTWTAIKTVYS